MVQVSDINVPDKVDVYLQTKLSPISTQSQSQTQTHTVEYCYSITVYVAEIPLYIIQ